MKCFVMVLIVMAAKWTAGETSCQYSYQCSGRYKNCCDKKCDLRRFCSNYCRGREDCASGDYCVQQQCVSTKPENYCDLESLCEDFHQRCVHNKCQYYCSCARNEKCVDGKCQKDDPSFSPASIAGLAAVVVIGSCIACGIYCGCARKMGRQPRQQQQQQQPDVQLSVQQDSNLHDVRDVEAGEESSNVPIHPGGPPPYHSLERINGPEELPPPTYEEAVRNSHNNLNAI